MQSKKYDEDFKKSIVTLHENGKTQSELSREYGISLSAISRWVRLYSKVKTDDGEILTAKQVKDLQKRLLQLEVCSVLNVNRSTYYKHFSSAESARAKEDRQIKSYILTLHGRYKKRLGVNKLTLLLQRENANISNAHKKSPPSNFNS